MYLVSKKKKILINFAESEKNDMKDNFSDQAELYACYRPDYPEALYQYLYGHTPRFESAWDCGAGNGQVAQVLSRTFSSVYASDISARQLASAPDLPNVIYRVEAAEACSFDAGFDLIVAAQAAHWFKLETFFNRLDKHLKPDGLLAFVGYGLPRLSPAVQSVLLQLYYETLAGYWDPERILVDQHYADIYFPIKQLDAPTFEQKQRWRLSHLIGYLNTWSAVQHFIRQNQINPIERHLPDFLAAWEGEEEQEVCFPVFVKAGKI